MRSTLPTQPPMAAASRRRLRIRICSALNRIFKRWAEIFNNDTTLTTALLDRLLHHCEVVTIEGKSYRMKDKIEDPEGLPSVPSQ